MLENVENASDLYDLLYVSTTSHTKVKHPSFKLEYPLKNCRQ